MERHGVLEAVLPEVAALRGVEQSVYHHLDVYEHTLATLAAVVEMQEDPAAVGLGDVAEPVRALLAEPLADDLARGSGLRLAALLHDAAKPQTRATRPDGGISFYEHHVQGAELARATLRRLRTSERLAAYVSALTLHHLRLGFLVHERPIDRRAVWRYLTATAPNSADVTLLTVADRMATRGRKADAAIAAHVELAVEMLRHAFAQREAGPQRPLVAGDELAAALGIRPGPELGALLAQIEEDRFVGEVTTPEEAVARARELRGG
jgi:putative nucleotidyltransferase with HDIG domain